MEDGVAHINESHLAFSKEATVAFPPPFTLAASFCAVLCVTHLVTAAFIAWNDLSGSWSKYALCKTVAQADRSKCYIEGLVNFLKDVGFILLPGLIWYVNSSASARDDLGR